MKRRICIIAVLLLLAALICGGTLAYYTITVTTENVVATGNIRLDIHQEGTVETGVDILPGDTVEKITTVENSGDHPMFLRVKLETSVENDAALSADEVMEIPINEKDWTEKDGYYYYNRILQPGEVTRELFTRIHFSGERMDNRYLGKKLVLSITASAVQSEHNGTEPLEARGWPAD